jgi:hypothetical protein
MEKAKRGGGKTPPEQAQQEARPHSLKRGGRKADQPTAMPKRRAGDVEQAWQRAKLPPGRWPYPGPVHGKARLTWAVLPTGEVVKWSDLGLDRRLDERIKQWRRAGK